MLEGIISKILSILGSGLLSGTTVLYNILLLIDHSRLSITQLSSSFKATPSQTLVSGHT